MAIQWVEVVVLVGDEAEKARLTRLHASGGKTRLAYGN